MSTNLYINAGKAARALMIALAAALTATAQQNEAFFNNLFRQNHISTPILRQAPEPEWVFFHNRINGNALTCADLSLNEVIEPVKGLYAAKMELPAPEGGEQEARQAIGSLFRGWKNTGGTVLAGAILNGSTMEIYAYTKDTAALKKACTEARLTFTPEPDWNTFTSRLMPNNPQLQEVANEKWVRQMAEQGDNSSKKRIITHTASFPTVQSRADFAKFALAKGFRVKSQSQHAGELPFAIAIERPDATTLDAINQLTNMLWEAAGRCKGTYETWEAQVVK